MASIVVKDCVCRQNCAPNGKNLGIVEGTFQVLEERDRGGVLWYRIGEDRWVQSGSGVDVVPDESDKSSLEDESSQVEEATVEDVNESEETSDDEYEEDDSESTFSEEIEYDEDQDAVESDNESVSTEDGASEEAADIEESTTIPDDITNDSMMYAIGDKVTFSGNKHYASPKGGGGAVVKPCMAQVVEVHHGEDYPLKLHRCNAAGHLISKGRMGFVSTKDVYPI